MDENIIINTSNSESVGTYIKAGFPNKITCNDIMAFINKNK